MFKFLQKFKKFEEESFTDQDVRFTTKDENLYAVILDWPGNGKEFTIANITLMNTRVKPVKGVSLLGYEGEIKWEQHPDGLKITMPDKNPGEYAYAFKIQFHN